MCMCVCLRACVYVCVCIILYVGPFEAVLFIFVILVDPLCKRDSSKPTLNWYISPARILFLLHSKRLSSGSWKCYIPRKGNK